LFTEPDVAVIVALPLATAVTRPADDTVAIDELDVAHVSSLPLLMIGGFLAGLGACVSNGCTSGHGICGMGRLSKRSFAVTVTFMATAVVTVYLSRHLFGVL
jgi:uncharacterized membrane protein YedE/YeeE